MSASLNCSTTARPVDYQLLKKEKAAEQLPTKSTILPSFTDLLNLEKDTVPFFILLKLEVGDLGSLSRVSKRCHFLANNQDLWDRLYQRSFGEKWEEAVPKSNARRRDTLKLVHHLSKQRHIKGEKLAALLRKYPLAEALHFSSENLSDLSETLKMMNNHLPEVRSLKIFPNNNNCEGKREYIQNEDLKSLIRRLPNLSVLHLSGSSLAEGKVDDLNSVLLMEQCSNITHLSLGFGLDDYGASKIVGTINNNFRKLRKLSFVGVLHDYAMSKLRPFFLEDLKYIKIVNLSKGNPFRTRQVENFFTYFSEMRSMKFFNCHPFDERVINIIGDSNGSHLRKLRLESCSMTTERAFELLKPQCPNLTQERANFLSLPKNIHFLILNKLDVRTLIAFSLVCKKYYHISSSKFALKNERKPSRAEAKS